MKVSSETKRLLTLAMLPGVGPATLKKVASVKGFENFGVESLSRLSSSLHKALSVPDAWSLASERAEFQVSSAEKHEARIISPLDPDYPVLLAATKDDPFILYVCGELHAHALQSVAIIGTREPTPHGEVITRRVTEYFVENQWSIVSGLALGCDGLAHQAALDSGGHTVAVLAHGLQMIAPSQHAKLAHEILESGGALISEYPFGQKVFPQQYVKRDRTQAGMAHGVVMIQSDIKGGSLYASRAALDYDRWLAVPLPTSADRSNREPKVMANLLIAEGDWVDKANLLKCTKERLGNILVLRTRDDYPNMISRFQSGSLIEVSDTANLCGEGDVSELLVQQHSLLQETEVNKGCDAAQLRGRELAKKSIYLHDEISSVAKHLRNRIEEMERVGDRNGAALEIIAYLVMLGLTFESRLNFIGEQKVSSFKAAWKFDRKLELVLKSLGLEPDFSDRPYSSVKQLKSFRDTIAHGKLSENERDRSVGSQSRGEDDGGEIRGRWEGFLSIEFTRQCSDDIASVLGEWAAAAGI